MNVDQSPEQLTLRERLTRLWNSRHRVVMLISVLATGLVLNCCCVIIPLWDVTGGP